MDYTFKQLKLSDAERLWLTEIMKANFSPIDARSMKIMLWKNLPEDFNPKAIDGRLVRDNRLTLVGLWHVNPNSPIFSHVSKTIAATRDLIVKNPEIKRITAKEISELTGVGERDVEIALLLTHDLPGFFGGGSANDRYGFREADFWQDDSGYDEFLRFENLDRKMEEFFVDRNPPRKTKKRTLSKEEPMPTSETIWKQPSSQDIWSAIYGEFEVNQFMFGKNINFVKDRYKRKTLFRDTEDAYILSKSGFYKPAVILAGGVIEELLRLYCTALGFLDTGL